MNMRNVARGAALPAVLILVLLGALVAVVVLSGSVGDEDAPPQALPLVPPEPSSITARDVKQRDGGTFTLIEQTVSGTAEESVQFAGTMTIERLAIIDATGVEAGDWVTIVGVPDPVNNFAVHSVVVIPGGGTAGEDGLIRTPAGFTGHEIARDPRDRPIVGGLVLRIEDSVIYVAGPTGEIVITVGPEAPARLYRVESAELADVAEGDRLAGNFEAGLPAAILLLPGGAAG